MFSDAAVITAIITSGGLVLVAIVTGISKKWKTPESNIAELQARETVELAKKVAEDDAEAARLAAEREVNGKLLERFQTLLAESDARHENEMRDIRAELKKVKDEVIAMRDEREVLVNFIYQLIRIIRNHGHVDEIPEPPHGIYIH